MLISSDLCHKKMLLESLNIPLSVKREGNDIFNTVSFKTIQSINIYFFFKMATANFLRGQAPFPYPPTFDGLPSPRVYPRFFFHQNDRKGCT